MELVTCTHGIQKTNTSKHSQKCTIQKSSMIIPYTTFEEIVGSELSTELKVREGKNEAKPALTGWIDALEETSSEELEFPGNSGVKMHNQGV